MPTPTVPQPDPDSLHASLQRNIAALAQRRREEEARSTWDERVATAVTGFAGSLRFVWLHLAVVGAWVLVNLGWVPGLAPFDPGFNALGLLMAGEAILLSTFVLITQNRMSANDAKRADLDLQVSLLAEHEITQLVEMVANLSEHMGLRPRSAEVEEIEKDVAPEAVLDAIEAQGEPPGDEATTVRQEGALSAP